MSKKKQPQSNARRKRRNQQNQMRKMLEKAGASSKDIDNLFRENGAKDAPRVVRITYADKKTKDFTAFEWKCFGPMITERLLDKGLATKDKIKADAEKLKE